MATEPRGTGTWGKRVGPRRDRATRRLKAAAFVATLGLIAGSAGAGEPPRPAGAPSAWTLYWEDDFDGPAGTRPDPSKWTVRVVPRPANNEMQYYTDRAENVSIDGSGHLVITARKESYGGRRYTSGRMDSAGKLDVAYGRFEAAIKMGHGQGVWPAFWLLGSTFPKAGWPNCGEIDVMENIGREPGTVHGTLHGPGYSGGAGIGASCTLSGGRFADAFHVFAVEWEPNAIRWYVDGKLYQTRTPDDLKGKAWAFDHDFYIILNLAIGGDWPGPPDGGTVFPQTLTFDYVRVYRRGSGPAPAPAEGSVPPAPEAPPPANLASGKAAASSSDESAAWTPQLAVDGNAGTRWSSGFSDPQWIRIDLGSTQAIRRVVLRWEAAYAKSYEIQTSNDGASWTTIYATTAGAGGVDDLSVSGSGRYVRLYGTKRGTPYGYSLWEFEVYGAGAVPGT